MTMTTTATMMPAPAVPEDIAGLPRFRQEIVPVSLLSGEMVDICIADAVLQGIDEEGRICLRLRGRDRRYRGRLIVYSDVAGWRCGWEIEGFTEIRAQRGGR